MIAQYISLLIGVVMIIANIKHVKNVWRKVFWVGYWGLSVVFYVVVLFTGIPSHDLSSLVRVAQYSMLAAWFLLGIRDRRNNA